MTAEPLTWPLPAGHRYGLNPYDITIHDGTESYSDHHSLWQWQHKASLVDRDLVPTGKFSGPTQRACIDVQRVCDLTINAELDKPTWDAVFSGLYATQSAEQTQAVQPAGPRGRSEPGKLSGVVDTPAMKRARAEARSAESTANKILHRNRHKGQAPAWYDLDEPDKYAKVRSILGVPRGDLDPRIRGVQRRAGLPETGSLDPATAWVLDEM